jgi:hypothetical protein
MTSNSNYETLYGVGLLDDLHNYFPALLYDSSGFRSVQDVLTYVHQQTRNRFDLFSYGLREYLSSNAPRVPPVSETHRRVVRTSYSQVLPITSQRNSTLPTVSSIATAANQTDQIREPLNIQIDLQTIPRTNREEEEEEDEEEEMEIPPLTNSLLRGTESQMANALLALLQIPTTGLTRNYVMPNLNDGRMTVEQMLFGRNTMDEFLQPVVVRPTAEQIAQNTTLGNLVSDTEHSCAVCQDALTSEQEGRKLNACGHWFHKTCIDTWLQGNVHCPVCRHDIREPMTSSPTQ